MFPRVTSKLTTTLYRKISYGCQINQWYPISHVKRAFILCAEYQCQGNPLVKCLGVSLKTHFKRLREGRNKVNKECHGIIK